MKLDEMIERAQDAITVRRVFGEPVQQNGITVIPVATIRGGGGGGEGEGPDGACRCGSGGGFGIIARPAGAYVIRDEDVDWRPAIDVTALAVRAETVVIAILITVQVLARTRARSRRGQGRTPPAGAAKTR